MKEHDPTSALALAAVLTAEFQLPPQHVANVLKLLAEDNTIPFIARYRKEQTGSLDEVVLRDLRDRALYLTELEERRAAVLASIEEQGKLTDELKARILAADTKQTLEDLYLPYRPKRRTRAQIAREKGLEPLAHALFIDKVPDAEADALVTAFIADYEPKVEEGKPPEVMTPELAWAGCRDIVAEMAADDADSRAWIRDTTRDAGLISSTVNSEFAEKQTRFNDYYEFSEPIKRIPAHRYLALRRGETEKVLRVRVQAPEEAIAEYLLRRWAAGTQGRLGEQWKLALDDAYQRLISSAVEVDLRVELKEKADTTSIGVFSENLRNLLLQPPGGAMVVLGLDPGFRTGSKWVVLDNTGRLLENGTIYPLPPQSKAQASAETISALCRKHAVELIAIGNGTASRELLAFARQTVKENELSAVPLMVSESGASIYSASDLAREEFPELDLTVRGAISIGRRFQDPLAELVKIDPKSLGVGQYQHDVQQTRLKASLDETVTFCVNQVGVNLNTASWALLRYVSGLGTAQAKEITRYRDENGPFAGRDALGKVPRLGPKAFQQCAGFLRIPQGEHPLDNSAVHPEHYALVENMAADLGVKVHELVNSNELIDKIAPAAYATETVGLPTLQDIIAELRKPGRDPREPREVVRFSEVVTEIAHLLPGMKLNGVVTNLTHFGAFVDIGVHQDGLVHVSQLSDTFVKDPAQVVKVGQPVEVRVLEVDAERKRISLTMRAEPGEGAADSKPVARASAKTASKPTSKPDNRAARGKAQANRGDKKQKSRTDEAPAAPADMNEALKMLNNRFSS